MGIWHLLRHTHLCPAPQSSLVARPNSVLFVHVPSFPADSSYGIHHARIRRKYLAKLWRDFSWDWTQMLTSSGCISLVKMFRVIPCVNTNSAHTRTSFQIFKLPEWRISQLPNAFQLYNDNECKNCIHPACKGVDVSCQGRVVRECAKCWYEAERLNKVCGFLLQCFFCLAAFSFLLDFLFDGKTSLLPNDVLYSSTGFVLARRLHWIIL